MGRLDRLVPIAASRRTREFVKLLSEGIFQNLDSTQNVFQCFGRRSREEWLYGMLCQVICGLEKFRASPADQTDFIITELPAERLQEKDGYLGMGKIDLVFSYRNMLVLMEIKATLCAEKPGDPLPSNISSRWDDVRHAGKFPQGVVDQLKRVSLENNNNEIIRKIMTTRNLDVVIPLPMLLVTYQRQSKEISKLETDVKVKEWHDAIWKSKELGENCEMHHFHEVNNPTLHESKSRRGPDILRKILGYGIFAGDNRLPVWASSSSLMTQTELA